jgi:hypothetical protein
MNEPGARQSSAAERMRLHRERRREGMRCLWIELHATEIDALVGLALLKPEMRNDPNAIREALYAYFDQTLTSAS